MSDWIEGFLETTEGVRSPRSFRLWTAISIIASTLERRVWTETDVDPLFPNLYIILAGLPASGKTIMVSTAKKFLSTIATPPDGVYIGPDNPNKATFLDCIEKSNKVNLNGMGFETYSAICVLCMELGVFISKYDKEFISDMTTIYDNPDTYTAPRRVAKSIELIGPTINMLAAATPDAIGDIIPEVAWGQGFTSRFIFIYGIAPQLTRNIFKKRSEVDVGFLERDLKSIMKESHGEVIWEPDAQDNLTRWYNVEAMAPVPTYARLSNYASRRDTHVMKLAMVSAASAGHSMIVTNADFERARGWMLEAEVTMPDIFRAIGQKSDVQIMRDIHHMIWVKYNDKRQFTNQQLWQLFEDRCPADRIPHLIKAMEVGGRIRQLPLGDDWVPLPMF